MSPARPIAVVAEDEVILRLDAVDMLEGLGFDVREAPHAAGAVQHLEDCECVALLFTDISMPGEMNGHALAHHCAQRWPETAIIVCSGCMPHEAAGLPDRAHFIGKPCVEMLVRKALKALELH